MTDDPPMIEIGPSGRYAAAGVDGKAAWVLDTTTGQVRQCAIAMSAVIQLCENLPQTPTCSRR